MSEETKKVSTKSKLITIDGKEFRIEKLHLGGQLELTSVVGDLLQGTMIDVANPENINIDIGKTLLQSPQAYIKILAIGLQTTEEEVRSFTDTQEAFKAVKLIIEVNDISSTMGKSMTLLGQLMA